jgi:hypothetical protein
MAEIGILIAGATIDYFIRTLYKSRKFGLVRQNPSSWPPRFPLYVSSGAQIESSASSGRISGTSRPSVYFIKPDWFLIGCNHGMPKVPV